MKHIVIILFVTIAALILSVKGKIPDYIHVCKRNDPKLDECVKNSIEDLKPKLIEGIPELDIHPIDPLNLKKLVLSLGPGFNAEGQDLVIRGGKNFEIRDLSVDIKTNTFTFTVFIPNITAIGNYNLDATIASIPLKGKGPMELTAKSVIGRGILRGKRVNRNGKTYNWYPSMNLKINVEDYDLKLENLFEGDSTIGEVTSRLLREEKDEVLKSLLPGIEKALTEHTLLAANNIAKNFPWDELLPES